MINIYAILAAFFSLTEIVLLLLKRSKSPSTKSRADRRSLLLFWITIPVSFTIGNVISARYIGLPGNAEILPTAGIVVFVIGFIIRWVSIFQLGSMFTVDVSISSSHILKTNGLYQLARHPSYLGLMLIIAGISLFMSNWLSTIIIVVAIFTVTNYRIAVEEKALTAEFGSQYDEYKKRVRKIVPFIY